MRKIKKNGSAQVLILAALAIALIISSTQLYVFQLSQVSSGGNPFSPQDFVRIVKLGSRNLMIGLLANISHGGNSQALENSLERWASFVEGNYHFGESSLKSDLCVNTPYSSGLWISWEESGSGVTSVKADFHMNLTSKDVTMNVDYSVNITTYIFISGTSTYVNATHKRINVKSTLCNEGAYALVKNLTVYYRMSTDWLNAGLIDGYSLEDFGNGTYRSSFVIESLDPVEILVQSYDRRDIFVRANATCTDS